MKNNGDRNEPSRLPYLPMYVDDWLSSLAIASFTLEQEAAYARLLKWEWKDPTCSLPNDESVLAQYSRLGPRWKKVGRPIIERCFVRTDEGRLVNPKLHEIWLKVQDKTSKAIAAANTRWERERQGRLPDPAAETWREMVRTYGRCLRCGRTDRRLVKDHVIPRYQGGADTPQNWQPLCTSCNSSKGPDSTDYRVGLLETKLDWLPKKANGGA